MVIRIPHPNGGYINVLARELSKKEEKVMRQARKFARVDIIKPEVDKGDSKKA